MILQAFIKNRIFSCNFSFSFYLFILWIIFENYLSYTKSSLWYFLFEIVCTIWCTVFSYVSMQTAIQNGYFKNCDYYVRLDANEGTSVINPGGYISILGYFGYLGFYDPGSSCRYFIECPRNYVIRLYCHINVAVTVIQFWDIHWNLNEYTFLFLTRAKGIIAKRSNFVFSTMGQIKF